MAKKMSFTEMLGATVIPGTDSKKKKEQLPIINLDKEMSEKLKTFIAKKNEMKAAEGEMRLAETPVLEKCLERMDKDALDSDFHSSYEVKTVDGVTAKFITVDKFNLSQEPENVQALRDLLGDKFDDEVEEKPTVIMRSEVFEDEKLQKELASIMGEKFSKFFQTQIKYVTKSGFDERMYKIAGKQEKVEMIRTMCGKNKPFFK